MYSIWLLGVGSLCTPAMPSRVYEARLGKGQMGSAFMGSLQILTTYVSNTHKNRWLFSCMACISLEACIYLICLFQVNKYDTQVVEMIFRQPHEQRQTQPSPNNHVVLGGRRAFRATVSQTTVPSPLSYMSWLGGLQMRGPGGRERGREREREIDTCIIVVSYITLYTILYYTIPYYDII